MRILELFCGIGGVAAAIGERDTIVAAVDISRAALDVYAHNFPHPTIARELETIPGEFLRDFSADLWWLSPPCQPYTRRGNQRDVDDPRARSLLALIDRIDELRPPRIALENVPDFAGSRAHERLRQILDRAGYEVREQTLCPTQLGIPMRRERFYLMAATGDWISLAESRRPSGTASTLLNSRSKLCLSPSPETARDWPVAFSIAIADFLHHTADKNPSLSVAPSIIDGYEQAIHIIDRHDRAAVAHCFTAAYGRSIVKSGSYLRTAHGIRRFSPLEIARLMGFGDTYRFPPGTTTNRAWQLIGNSLSVDAVRWVLGCIR